MHDEAAISSCESQEAPPTIPAPLALPPVPPVVRSRALAPEGQPKLTLEAILADINGLDDLAEQAIDWAAVIGDELRDKVDAIDYVLENLKFRAAFWEKRAAPMLKRAKAADANYESLRAHIAEVMERQQFKSIPGHECRIDLMEAQPSLVLTRKGATAMDAQTHPALVEVIRGYKWRNDQIKDALLSGALPPECEFARLKTSKHIKVFPIKINLPKGSKNAVKKR